MHTLYGTISGLVMPGRDNVDLLAVGGHYRVASTWRKRIMKSLAILLCVWFASLC